MALPLLDGAHVLLRWHIRSNETARDNARVAATREATRRRDREEVEHFLESYARAAAVPAKAASPVA